MDSGSRIAWVRTRPRAGSADPELIWGIVGAGLLVLLHIGLPPALPGIPCLFKALLGIPCPSCGMTRSWQALAQGEWALALRMHPLLPLGMAFVWAYVPYALGAALGAWPRLRISPSPALAQGLRLLAVTAVLAVWGFLIRDGR